MNVRGALPSGLTSGSSFHRLTPFQWTLSAIRSIPSEPISVEILRKSSPYSRGIIGLIWNINSAVRVSS